MYQIRITKYHSIKSLLLYPDQAVKQWIRLSIKDRINELINANQKGISI